MLKSINEQFWIRKILLGNVRERLFLCISLRLNHNYNSWVYNDFSTDYLMILLQWDFPSLYSPSLLHLSPLCVDQIAGFDTCPISTFLKSWWVAVRLNEMLLFRYHLHINAVRELTAEHLILLSYFILALHV